MNRSAQSVTTAAALAPGVFLCLRPKPTIVSSLKADADLLNARAKDLMAEADILEAKPQGSFTITDSLRLIAIAYELDCISGALQSIMKRAIAKN